MSENQSQCGYNVEHDGEHDQKRRAGHAGSQCLQASSKGMGPGAGLWKLRLAAWYRMNWETIKDIPGMTYTYTYKCKLALHLSKRGEKKEHRFNNVLALSA